MKHFLTLFGALLCPLASWAVSPPYSSAMIDEAAKTPAADWTIVNNNNDAKTWAYQAPNNSTDRACLYYYYTSNEADDWAVSPGIELQAGKQYAIIYLLKEHKALGSGTEILNLYAASQPDVASLKAGTLVAAHIKDMGNVYKYRKQYFTPSESGTYYFGFQANSPKNQWYIYLRDFTIKEAAYTPGQVTGLTVTPGADHTLSAALAWTLPDCDDDGNPLETPIDAVMVRRNGNIVATLPGDAVAFTDTTLPEGGKYTYSVTASINGSEGLAASVLSAWIGPKTAQQLPYFENFSDAEIFENLWGTIDVDGDCVKTGLSNPVPPYKFGWCLHTQNNSAHWPILYYPAASKADENDWLVSAPLKFPAAGKYKVSFKMSRYSTGTPNCLIDVYTGTGDNPEAFTQLLGTITSIASTELNPASGELKEYEFEVPAAGTYYIGWHAHMSGANNGNKDRRPSIGAFKAELLEAYSTPEPDPLDPPYNSADDENWTPVPSIAFNVEQGYYHVLWTADGTVSVDIEEGGIDSGFHPAMKVLSVTGNGTAIFTASNGSINSFMITPYDHTPSQPEAFIYTNKENGDVEFSFTAPSVNTSGTRLYEIRGCRIDRNGETVLETETCPPGETVTMILPAEGEVSAASLPEYSLVLHNLSGESGPVTAQMTSGINPVSFVGADSIRYYTPSGIQVSPANLSKGIYIKVSAGKTVKITVK